MLSGLVAASCASLGMSAICSLSEAALYAVPLAYAKGLKDNGSKAGAILFDLKSEPSRPIAAILVLNTLANTAGSAVAGALAAVEFGGNGVFYFSVVFTLLILFFGEILPKVIGVTFNRPVALTIAYPLSYIMKALTPVLWLAVGISRMLKGGEDEVVSAEEVKSLAALGTEEGVLDRLEGTVIKNVLDLSKRLVRDICTPRVVVERKLATLSLGEIGEEVRTWQHSRIPLYEERAPDELVGYVTQRDVLKAIIAGKRDATLRSISRPITFVPEFMKVDDLLHRMVERHEHIAAVADEHGSLAGIVTLEDALEEVVGREIVDEYDTVADLRGSARLQYRAQRAKAATNPKAGT